MNLGDEDPPDHPIDLTAGGPGPQEGSVPGISQELPFDEFPPPTSPVVLTSDSPFDQEADQAEIPDAPEQVLVSDVPAALPPDEQVQRSEVLTLGYGVYPPAESTRYQSNPSVSPQPDLFGIPDTALDALELPALSVRAVSVRGRDHRYEGSVRQDSYAVGLVEGTLICAVADGVGSASHSHVGATVASRWAAVSTWLAQRHGNMVAGAHSQENLDEHQPHGDDATDVDLTPIASQMLAETARIEGIEPPDVASTLVVATIQPQSTPGAWVDDDDQPVERWLATLYSIGDSGMALVRDGEWQRIAMVPTASGDATGDSVVSVPAPDNDDRSLSNQTGIDALPTTTTAISRTVLLQTGDVLVLATDGILDLVAGVEAFREEFVGLWHDQDPTMAQLLRVIDGLVKSYSDDRTIIAVRVGGGHDG